MVSPLARFDTPVDSGYSLSSETFDQVVFRLKSQRRKWKDEDEIRQTFDSFKKFNFNQQACLAEIFIHHQNHSLHAVGVAFELLLNSVVKNKILISELFLTEAWDRFLHIVIEFHFDDTYVDFMDAKAAELLFKSLKCLSLEQLLEFMSVAIPRSMSVNSMQGCFDLILAKVRGRPELDHQDLLKMPAWVRIQHAIHYHFSGSVDDTNSLFCHCMEAMAELILDLQRKGLTVRDVPCFIKSIGYLTQLTALENNTFTLARWHRDWQQFLLESLKTVSSAQEFYIIFEYLVEKEEFHGEGSIKELAQTLQKQRPNLATWLDCIDCLTSCRFYQQFPQERVLKSELYAHVLLALAEKNADDRWAYQHRERRTRQVKSEQKLFEEPYWHEKQFTSSQMTRLWDAIRSLPEALSQVHCQETRWTLSVDRYSIEQSERVEWCESPSFLDLHRAAVTTVACRSFVIDQIDRITEPDSKEPQPLQLQFPLYRHQVYLAERLGFSEIDTRLCLQWRWIQALRKAHQHLCEKSSPRIGFQALTAVPKIIADNLAMQLSAEAWLKLEQQLSSNIKAQLAKLFPKTKIDASTRVEQILTYVKLRVDFSIERHAMRSYVDTFLKDLDGWIERQSNEPSNEPIVRLSPEVLQDMARRVEERQRKVEEIKVLRDKLHKIKRKIQNPDTALETYLYSQIPEVREFWGWLKFTKSFLCSQTEKDFKFRLNAPPALVKALIDKYLEQLNVLKVLSEDIHFWYKRLVEDLPLVQLQAGVSDDCSTDSM